MVIGLCAAAVFVAKAVTGEEAVEHGLTSPYEQGERSPLVEQFFGLERTPVGRWPKWLIAAYHAGEWRTDPPPLAFHVPAAQEENSGVLSLQVDRALAGEDLVLALTYCDDQGKGSLYIGLSYWPEGSDLNENERAIFLGDLFGNIMQGQGETATEYFEIPVQSVAARYLSVDIYRGEGEITAYGAALYTKSEFYCRLEQALAPAVVGLEREAGAAEQDEASAESAAADSGSDRTAALKAQEAGVFDWASLAEQIAAAAQVAANLMITRSALSGGGGRLTSENFILEDTFGQSSTIGFSYGSGVTLHWGYQQAEVERLAAQVRLEPEVLKVNPGILTAFVELPEGYPVSGITSATCDGALYERMMLNDDQTEMIIKFRRRDIEAALAAKGEALDTHFVVEGTWQGPEGSIPFMGEDDIARIVN